MRNFRKIIQDNKADMAIDRDTLLLVMSNLRESEARLRFLSEFEEAIRGLKDPGKIMEVATRKTAGYLRTSRCAYADVEPDGNHFTIRNDYVADESASTAGFYSLASFGTKAVKELNAGQILIIQNMDEELALGNGADMFNALGIKAIIVCPLVKEGRLHAMMAVHQNVPRVWTQEEIRLMQSISDRSWSHIERVRFDARMRESEEQFRHLANAMPQVVWTATPEGHLDYVNDRCHQYSGDAKTEDGKTQWISIIHPDDIVNTLETWKNCVRTGTAYDIQQRIYHKESNTYRWNLTRAVPIKDKKGKITKWYGTNTDIQDQREANEKLREVKEHLELVLASATDFAIISMDMNGSVISWSKGAERIFQYSTEEVLGKEISFIFTPEDQENGAPLAERATAIRSGRAEDERWHIRKNGTRFYVSGILATMYDGSGAEQGFTKIARDVTAQKYAEEAIIEARNAAEAANSAKTEFLANISHEIRTPMNAIIGLSNILSISEPLTEKQREYINTLQISADSLLALINDLLDISKIEARTIELEQIPFNFLQLIQEVMSIVNVTAKRKGLNVTFNGECIENHSFIGDPTRLRQILINLCSNAVKFTEKGFVHIEASCGTKTSDGLQEIVVEVRDTGIGIAPRHLETIFEKFVQADSSITRKYGGTGLGLAITKTLAEVMGGTIEVESQVGKGSVFTLLVPLRPARKEEIAFRNEALENVIDSSLVVPLSSRILLVEDHDPNIIVATAFLEEFGYQYDLARNGYEAVAKFKKGHYDLVLMDVQMQGMNGFETTQAIRVYERNEGLKPSSIIGMTAHALTGDRERCIESGMDDYISKPFHSNHLKELLANYLNNK